MRIRRKPWARPELDACPYYTETPAQYKGHWREQFEAPDRPLHLELGCGKGGFIARMAVQNPQINYIAMDIKSEMLALARRNLEAAFQGEPVRNVKLCTQEIELIHQSIAPQDEIDRIYINFCNPWPKAHHHKKRLTHPKQLIKYLDFLRDGGQIWFKTDDSDLFAHSRIYFAQCGFPLDYLTGDLHNSGFTESVSTEHERMFTAQGIPTKFLIARCDREKCRQAVRVLQEENPKYQLQRILPGEKAAL